MAQQLFARSLNALARAVVEGWQARQNAAPASHPSSTMAPTGGPLSGPGWGWVNDSVVRVATAPGG